MRILVITSCTGRKKHKPRNQLKYEDFASPERLCQRTSELKDFKAPAAEMYTGQQHRFLMTGLKQVREKYGKDVVDLNIISAGYGLIRENKVIVPYDVTFGSKKQEIIELSDKLQIPEEIKALISDYDLVFFLLGQKYVQALQCSFKIHDAVTQIFLAAPSWKRLIPDHLQNIHVACVGVDLVDQLDGATRYNLKGFVFKRLCEAVCRDGLQVFEQIKQNPQQLIKILLGQ